MNSSEPATTSKQYKVPPPADRVIPRPPDQHHHHHAAADHNSIHHHPEDHQRIQIHERPPQPTAPPPDPSSGTSSARANRVSRRRPISHKKNTQKHPNSGQNPSLPGSGSGTDTTSTVSTCQQKNTSPDHSPHQPKTIIPSRPQHITSSRVGEETNLALLGSLCRVILWPLKWIVMVVLPHTLGGMLKFSILVMTFYLLGISLKHQMEKLILSSSISMVTTPLRALSIPVAYVYCSILRGTFCGSGTEGEEIHIGQVARTVTGTAQQASDIFDSVVQLSDPTHLGLYQTEILELGFAVRWSSDLQDKTALADGLNELSDLTRQLKDHLIDLNGRGLNTFSFIAYQFSRLSDLIEWVQSGKKAYTTGTIKQNLDILFENLSRELTKLLNTIESLIPLASRSTDLGTQISERLHRQHYQLVDQKSNQNLWKKLLDLASFEGHQLNRDLDLTALSIRNLRSTWLKLEDIRTDLLTYRNNVANFKASFTGWHLADHGLTPDDEILSMRQVIESFELTLKSVKSDARVAYASSSSSSSSHKLLSTAPASP